ncbi:sensor histidine kinase [Streptomyces natalensis]|uniref:histidine kinase n=1 Tax=Streptomyces natalensis ATCC 27448 TaxID=1240678 RepID=A0A0D7CH32_9ACTN|nr:HAMP domain-containing sensor histidine kinase [Streptomyces natalensis]KIZ14702.1 histidine kinase [Streptomyces natalensis ATCC 27448]
MRTRLLPLLIALMTAVLLALGFPLAMITAGVEQQKVVVDRIDDAARFAALAQFVTARPDAGNATKSSDEGERRATLGAELARYYDLYGIRAGVFYRDRKPMCAAPRDLTVARDGEAAQAFSEALAGRRSHDPRQIWPWDDHGRITVASPVIRDGDVVAVVVTDSPTDQLRSRILRGWLVTAAGECVAMLIALAAAFRLTGWVLRPVRVLDAASHDIATGRMKARVAATAGPPELRRLARSFNEMADHVEDVLEQQRAFVADASHQLRNPLSALLLRIELLALELPDGNEEIASVRTEGKRLARVLDDLLGLALAEHTAADLQLTDIGALAAERVDSWRPLADDKGVRLTYEGHSAVTGWADPVALSSALDAVVDNALKFTPPTEPVTVAVAPDGERVTITVTDRGPGLTDDELARIGDRFWRSSRHQNVSGSGLGLSITRALLAAGGADIGYAPHPPHGLKVTVTVPRTGP